MVRDGALGWDQGVEAEAMGGGLTAGRTRRGGRWK